MRAYQEKKPLQAVSGNGASAAPSAACVMRAFKNSLRPALQSSSPDSPEVVQRKVGFEFQMLQSQVELKNNGRDAEILQNWRNNQAGWHIEKDGLNLEFVTRPMNTLEEGAAVMGEITAVADLVAATPRGVSVSNGQPHPKTIRVLESDTGGQPQVNADISLSNFLDASDSPQIKPDAPHHRDYFAADRPRYLWRPDENGPAGLHDLHWTPKETDKAMERLIQIKRFVNDQYKDSASLRRNFGLLFFGENYLSDTFLRIIFNNDNGLYDAIKTYLVLESYIQTTAPLGGHLSKDMPLLPKVDLAFLESAITSKVMENLRGAGDFPEKKDYLQALNLRAAFNLSVWMINKHVNLEARSEKKKIDPYTLQDDPFYESIENRPNTRVVAGVKQAGRSPESLLMEYRRVPVLPVGEWEAFVAQAIQDLGDLG